MPNPACTTLAMGTQYDIQDVCHKLSRVALAKTTPHHIEASVVQLPYTECSQGIDNNDKSVLRIELRGGKNNCFLAAIAACGLGKVYPPSGMASICKTLRLQLNLSKSDALTTVEQRRVLQYYAMNVLIVLGNQITLCMAGPRGANRWAVLSLVHDHHVALVLREESLRPLVVHAKDVLTTLASLGITHAGWSDHLGYLGLEGISTEEHPTREVEGGHAMYVTTPLSHATQTSEPSAPPLPRGAMHAARGDRSQEGDGNTLPETNSPAPPAPAPADATPPMRPTPSSTLNPGIDARVGAGINVGCISTDIKRPSHGYATASSIQPLAAQTLHLIAMGMGTPKPTIDALLSIARMELADQVHVMLEEACKVSQASLDASAHVFQRATPEAVWLGMQLRLAHDVGDFYI